MLLLIVDDNEINLRVACAYLKALGVPPESIFTACDGKQAVESCEKNQFNMIFMDIQMPEVDGVEAAKMILANDEHQPVIIALTANTSEEAEAEYREAGMQMILHKPVNKSAFKGALSLLESD